MAPETPAQTPAPPENSIPISTSTKYAFKHIPNFNPTFYRAWASDVNDAFAERRWTDYLKSPPPDDFEPDPHIVIQSKAFLSQSIPYEHKAGIEDCTTAAQIFKSFKQHYGSASCEDELRLETQLMSTRKLATDTIDQHINKIERLIASIMAQQDKDKKYANDKRNQLFTRFITLISKTKIGLDSSHSSVSPGPP